jgi:hypothetical protein
MDPLQVGSRVNLVGLANKSRKKSGTLTDSAHARTVRAATADHPASGPNRLLSQTRCSTKAKVAIFLRHHIHPDLKMQYLEVKDPLVLWCAEACDATMGTIGMRYTPLCRLQEVEAYNVAIHHIIA